MNKLEDAIKMDRLLDSYRTMFPIEWSEHADRILEDRYFAKDKDGKPTEDAHGMLQRVVRTVANGDLANAEKYYEMIASGKFLPNTPTFVNADRPLGFLSACLVLPTGDSIEEWAESHKNHMICTKAGVGTGFDFSSIRQSGSIIKSTGGEAAGVMGMFTLLSTSAEVVKQGSIRPSANMGTLRINHPEIMDFIRSKRSRIEYYKDKKDGKIKERKVFDKFQNFNISVTAFDHELEVLFSGGNIDLLNPKTGEVVGILNGFEFLKEVSELVHDGGDPGFLFLTPANKMNDIINLINPITLEKFGLKFATNPCGEQWLYVFSVCNLGSLNLSKFVLYGRFDFELFRVYVDWAYDFLNDVIDVNRFPLAEIDIMSKYIRNIGLGLMGWADALIKLNISYDSDEAIKFGTDVLTLFKATVDEHNAELAKTQGQAPVYIDTDIMKRNYETTCIAPTGTISMIAGCSSGIEPNFSFAIVKKTTIKSNNGIFYMVNEALTDFLENKFQHKPQRDAILKQITDNGGVFNDDIARELGFPSHEMSPFKTIMDISPEWHIKHQALFQSFVDNAVSKTINVPESFTPEDIISAYKLAWKSGCKGITIYRNNSRSYQVLNIEKKIEEDNAEKVTSLKTENPIQSRKNQSKESYQNYQIQEERKEIIDVSPKLYYPPISTTVGSNAYSDISRISPIGCCESYSPIKTNGCTTCGSCGNSWCG